LGGNEGLAGDMGGVKGGLPPGGVGGNGLGAAVTGAGETTGAGGRFAGAGVGVTGRGGGGLEGLAGVTVPIT